MGNRSLNKLKQRRIELGYTQNQVAKKIGIVQQSYHRYERGDTYTSVPMAIRIAKALESTVEDLFGH